MRNTLIDAGPIIALFDRSDKYHQSIRKFLQDNDFHLITTWPAITEASHLLDFDVRAQVGLLKWIYRGGLRLHEIDVSGIQRVIELTEKYQDQPMDLADATLVVVAEETGILEIISIDSDFLVYRANGNRVIENLFKP